MAKFNYERMTASIANSPRAATRINTIAENKFAAARERLLEEFDGHDVTKEIEEGVDAHNITHTLNGYSHDGLDANLFTFIGFDEGDDPITPLREVLETELALSTSKRPNKIDKKGFRFRFALRIPTASIKEVTKMPWENGNSWAEGIEHGISGFSHYLRGVFNNPPSHSTGGVQADHEIRGGEFRTTNYLSDLFRKFVDNFRL